MKKVTFISVFLLLLASQVVNQPVWNNPGKGCSIFTIRFADKVFFCGNLDHPNPDGYIRFLPNSAEGFGGIIHGYLAKTNNRSWIAFEGGINEKGLAFDTNGLPNAFMNSHPEKPYSWGNENFWYLLLRKCSNAKDAINIAKKFNFGNSMNFQVHVADPSGDAVIISPGDSGELSFTRKEPGVRFLVSTNRNNANPAHGHGKYPCKRHVTISHMLGEIENEKNVSNEYLMSVLDSVHFERASYNTIYSYLCDLRKGLFFLYYFHQFDEVVVLDLKKELKSSERTVKIADLVSQETRDRASKEYQEYKRLEKEKNKDK